MDDVLKDTNHKAKATTNTPVKGAVGFKWDKKDGKSKKWYPQGVTGDWDTKPGATGTNHKFIAVSWYDKSGKSKAGTRVTLVNYDNPKKPVYRHVLLVEPTKNGKNFKPVKSHAGGLTVAGDKLYVADTKKGVRVFNLNNLWRTAPGATKKVGLDSNGKAHAAGYKYALPQVGSYTPVKKDMRFSSISIDHSTNSLVAGEYQKKQAGKPANERVVRWRLNDDGTLHSVGGVAKSTDTRRVSHPAMQGVLTQGDKSVMTTSAGQKQPGHIVRESVGKAAKSTSLGAAGPEDLSYDPETDRAWTQTEYPGNRAVFGIPHAFR
ncbi:hypothetical protein [Amycolatopsis taiwanensis]|uniref:Uncharacterized protein n=1 Tax=Amycolatopsis taiwanensis TaxID=342230 RepID=A0A9W6R5J8_9PSEU|nr:hypothetical protein [Amycolatopsis taiwanensis]GLY69073.1 hypothetical protein Atai01_56920 [Amycolatopsis taiwanensis]